MSVSEPLEARLPSETSLCPGVSVGKVVSTCCEIFPQFSWGAWGLTKSKRRRYVIVRMHGPVYEAWLKEDHKKIDGGRLELEVPVSPLDPEEVYLPAHAVKTDKLPAHIAESLMIYSDYDEFSGSMFHVGPSRPSDFLLAAHQRHNGPFRDHLGQEYVNREAHYHERDYYSVNGGGRPDEVTKVNGSLRPIMAPHELLEAFLNDYHFDDGREGQVDPPRKPKFTQGRL